MGFRLSKLDDQIWEGWHRISQPHPDVQAVNHRLSARALMVTSLLFMPLMLIHNLLLYFIWSPESYTQTGRLEVSAVGIIFLAIIYAMSYRGYVQSAARLALVFAFVIILISFMVVVSVETDYQILTYAAIPLVFLSLYLNSKEIFAVLIIQTLVLSILPTWDERVEFDPLVRVMAFWWMTTLIALVTRRYYQKAQLHQLNQAQDSELKYRLIFDSYLHVVMIHDGDVILMCNDAAAQICGYKTAAEVIGKPLREFIHPDDFEIVHERAKKHLVKNLEVPERYTLRVVGGDGSVRWVDSNSRVISYEGQLAVLATAIDITHRHLIENYLFRRVALDKIITTASTEFLNAQLEEIDQAVQNTLKAMGNYADMDHAYVMQINAHTLHCTHQWTRYGGDPQHARPQVLQPSAYEQILSGKIVKVANINELDDHLPEKQILREKGILAYLEVPMVSKGQVLGLVGFDSATAPQIWEEDTIFLLHMASEIFINAFERRRAESDLRQRNQELETLNALANIITTTLDANELLRRMTHLFGESFAVTSAYISNWNEAAHSITVIAEYISPEASAAEKISDLGETYTGQQWINQLPEAYRDTPVPHWIIHRADYPPNHPSPIIQHLYQYGAQSVLSMTLVINEKRVGALELWDSRSRREFSDDELILFQAMVKQAAIMLDRAWLYSELQDTEQQNRVILNALPDLIFRLRGDGRFLEYKHNSAAAHPLSPALFVNKLPQDVLSPFVAETLMTCLEAVLGNGEMQVFEYELGVDNDVYYYEARLVKILSDQVLMFVRDITPLKQSAQRQVELTFEKERVRILENFISDASHDLRTPIANLKSRLYLLKRADTAEKQNRQIEVLEQEMIRLENLIEDLLTMSQLDGTLLGRTLVEIAVNYLVQEVMEANSLNASHKGLQMHTHLTPDLPLILGDPSEFSRMLNNLVGNAISYTPAGGQIFVRTLLNEKGVVIEVEDTGMGIAEADLPHIFDRFYRADKARSTDRGGTGLGLAITKKIVEIHRGEITVKSRMSQGTTFRLSFPQLPNA